MDVFLALSRVGEVAHVRRLRALGVDDRGIYRAVESGRIRRLRPGWYASPLADVDQCRAVLSGARIGCVSALNRLGIWSGRDRALHLHYEPSAIVRQPPSGLFAGPQAVAHPFATRRARPRLTESHLSTVRHWTRERLPEGAFDWIVSAQMAAAEALVCQDEETGEAIIDSLLHEKLMPRRSLAGFLQSVPVLHRPAIDVHTGIPQSGVESTFLRRAQRAGFEVTPQYRHPLGGNYDGIINGCVLYEIDGFEFHSSAETFYDDRDRSLRSQAIGLPVIRPSARHVLDDWPMVLTAIEHAVADAEDLLRFRGRPRAG